MFRTKKLGVILSVVILGVLFWRTTSVQVDMLTVQMPLAGKVIVLDPGHGGYDSGAVVEGVEEKEIALIIALKTRELLEQAGAIVYVTREEDKDLVGKEQVERKKATDIRRRVDFIHESNADLFLTIHLNSLTSKTWRGAQTFYHKKYVKNKKIASYIQESFIQNLENTTRTPLEMSHVYLLKHSKVPGALVEVGFLSNDSERELLQRTSYQEKVAMSIYKGVLQYMVEEQIEQIN